MRLIAQISDLHFGRHDAGLAEALLASLGDRRPDLVVISGDFTQRARASEFALARRFLDQITQPKLVMPGNHDLPLYDVIARLLTPLAKFDRYIAPAGLPAAFFADAEIAVLGLDTARRLTGKNGRVSFAQMSEIRRVFAAVPSDLAKILATHHPLGSPAREAAVELAHRSRPALEAIAGSGVHLLLSGHHHRPTSGELGIETGSRNSVLIVHAGTSISTRTRGGDTNSYNLIRIDGPRLAVTVMAASGQRAFAASRAASYVLEATGWRPA